MSLVAAVASLFALFYSLELLVVGRDPEWLPALALVWLTPATLWLIWFLG